MLQKSEFGFTLVEIAVVLAVIGLLLTGILKGQEMITNARISNVVRNYNGLAATIFAYQDRYGALPGDDALANRFDDVGDAEVGDGDGIIDHDWDSGTTNNETRLFWLHLRNSGLIAGPTTTLNNGQRQGNNAYGGLMGAESNQFGMIGTVICFSSIAEDAIQIIDIKYDNGDAQTGDIRASPSATGDAEDGDYADGVDNDDNMCWSI